MLSENASGKVGDIYVEITTTTKVHRALFAVTFDKKRSGYQLKMKAVRDNGNPIYYVENEIFSKYDEVKSAFYIAGDEPIINYHTHVVVSQETSEGYYDQRYNQFDKETSISEERVYYYLVDELGSYASEMSYFTMDKSVGLLTAADKIGHICNINGAFTIVTCIESFIITDITSFINGSEFVPITSGTYRLKRSNSIPIALGIIQPEP